MRPPAFLPLLAVVLAMLPLAACSTDTTTELAVAPGQYAATFDAATATLRDWRFQLERIDGTAGVITTQPRTSGGAATPFDGIQSAPYDEVDELMSRERRRVRITFIPANATIDETPVAGAGAGGTGAAAEADAATESDIPGIQIARADQRPMTMRVKVRLERVHITGWRLSPAAVHTSSRSIESELVDRGLQGEYSEIVREDAALAARIIADIRSRLSVQTPLGRAEPATDSSPVD
ncbi:MAG: hypothetical protein H7Y88_07725 [Phycisphaerales bacterium]|nr:hypothetical protein [Phycisphaerales bacterium]